MNEPSFKEFGQFLFPTDFYTPTPGMKVSDAGNLLPYHTYINASDSCNVLNYLLNRARSGRRVFYNIYSEEARKLNPELEKTGLFFFRGRPDAPFAVICAGGGFAYVGSIHESFPHALELRKKVTMLLHCCTARAVRKKPATIWPPPLLLFLKMPQH